MKLPVGDEKATPENLEILRKRTADHPGTRWAAYHHELGHLNFLAIGPGCTHRELPVELPVPGYTFVGWLNLETGAIEESAPPGGKSGGMSALDALHQMNGLPLPMLEDEDRPGPTAPPLPSESGLPPSPSTAPVTGSLALAPLLDRLPPEDQRWVLGLTLQTKLALYEHMLRVGLERTLASWPITKAVLDDVAQRPGLTAPGLPPSPDTGPATKNPRMTTLLDRLPPDDRQWVLGLTPLTKLDLLEHLLDVGLEDTLAKWPSLKVQLDYCQNLFG